MPKTERLEFRVDQQQDEFIRRASEVAGADSVSAFVLAAALERAGYSGSNTTLVVAVSGGPDSLALLRTLVELQGSLQLKLTVAHLDHGLRLGSAEDAQFVADLSRSEGLPFMLKRTEVRAHQVRHRLSPEEAAREVRYAFLARAAQTVGAQAVTLGHTADDQAETVLLHLIRGSGLSGLRGMRPVSAYRLAGGASVTLFRPLLDVWREETEACCRAWGLTPREDETNRLPTVPRNYLRREVLPRLERLNPAVREALGRLARAVARDLEYLESEVERVWPSVVRELPGGLALDRQALAVLPPALQRHLLRRAYARINGDETGLEEAHVEALARLAADSTGAFFDLPRGVRLEVQRQRALLTRGRASCPLPALAHEHRICVPGETPLGEGWLVRAEVVAPPGVIEPGLYVASLDLDALGSPLWVRPRTPGDRFYPLGLLPGKTIKSPVRPPRGKKLQDFMVDAHIPRSWRDRVPLLVGPRGVAWVVGWRIAHWARVTPETRRILRLEFSAPGIEAGQVRAPSFRSAASL
jgi:tRNA(Ile)-lysidine synthase